MIYLLDTDHIVILQRQPNKEAQALSRRLAQHGVSDIAFSLVSFHEQVLGCHTFIARGRNKAEIPRNFSRRVGV